MSYVAIVDNYEDWMRSYLPTPEGKEHHLRVIFERCIALGLTEEQAEAVRDLAERSIP